MANPPDIWMNLFILTADLSQVREPDLDRFRALGVTGLELPGTVSEAKDCVRLGGYIRKHLLGAALNVAVTKDADPSSLDEAGRRKGIDYLKSRIDCATSLGASVVAGPIILPWGNWPKGLSGTELHEALEAKKRASLGAIWEVADYAAARGIKLAYEPLTHWEMPGLNTLAETIEYLKVLGHPNVGVTLDISHEVLDGEGPEIYAQQIDWLKAHDKIFYIQVSAPHRGALGKSWLPWQGFFGPLRRFWKGPIAIEIMNAVTPFAQANGEGLRLVRRPFEDPFAVAQEAIELVRKHWQDKKTASKGTQQFSRSRH